MNVFQANVITLHPEIFPGPLGISVIGNALQNNIWSLDLFDLRSFAVNKHGTVDDKPFGGGAGMVIMAEVVARAIEHIKSLKAIDRIIYFSPRGKVMRQADIRELFNFKSYIFICGRFEGIDERVLDEYNVEEFSLGDFVLSGGDIACMAMIDAYVRLLPNVVGNEQTLEEESFGKHGDYQTLLEYPQYTRPANWRGKEVPPVLVSGNHQKIREWKLNQALHDTKSRRPDLLKNNK
jgi:tRNA (guanine37-N1)-methyltransferase